MTRNLKLAPLAVSGFVLLHLGCLLVLAVPFSWRAVAVCAASYLVRMFGITAGFHRLLAHRSYSAGRVFQFVIAWLGTSSLQRGPLWWAGHHRHHHRYADTKEDVHSPVSRSFWWAHLGWVLSRQWDATDRFLVRDLSEFRELLWLDRWFLLPPLIMAILLLLSGPSYFVYGFLVSTTLLYHATFSVNSFAHRFGTRRFLVRDGSRNNFWVALITLGEGYHNNHHFYPSSERQGFYWWELDVAHYCLWVLERFGFVSGLREPPPRVYEMRARD